MEMERGGGGRGGVLSVKSGGKTCNCSLVPWFPGPFSSPMTGPASARVVLTDTRLLKWQGSQRTLTASQAFSFRETPVPSLVLRGGYGISLPLTSVLRDVALTSRRLHELEV